MKKTALFPGSFDPFTIGHYSIVMRALPMFDKIVIGIGQNSEKNGFFSLEKRKTYIKDVFKNEPKIEIDVYEGLTVKYCQEKNIGFILRGLRTAADFEYERAIAQVNRAMKSEIETVFLLTLPEHTALSSSIVREVARHKGDFEQFLPAPPDLLL